MAVVGSGPAGLTAAYYLAKSGHQVTVFEKLRQPGGMLRVGIPTYRLPRKVLDEEIAHIESAGVDIMCGQEIASVNALVDEGYDAVLVGIGAHRGVKLPIPGSDLPDVLLGTDFLAGASTGKPAEVGERVAVLGGGSVAFDCAGVVRRLSAKEVSLICLEPRDAMRATKEEIDQALEEGCVLHNAYTFDEITQEQGKVTGVRCRKVSSCVFDADGVPDICLAEDGDLFVPAQTVIFAVGQRPALAEHFGLILGRGNRIVVTQDGHGCATETPGIFAAGDAVTGTVSVVAAIAGGRRAARAIDQYLGGDGVIEETLAPGTITDPLLGRDEGYAARGRCPDEPQEAGRCLQCDLRLEITREKFWGEYRSAKERVVAE